MKGILNFVQLSSAIAPGDAFRSLDIHAPVINPTIDVLLAIFIVSRTQPCAAFAFNTVLKRFFSGEPFHLIDSRDVSFVAGDHNFGSGHIDFVDNVNESGMIVRFLLI
jgi:hypothetical protein